VLDRIGLGLVAVTVTEGAPTVSGAAGGERRTTVAGNASGMAEFEG